MVQQIALRATNEQRAPREPSGSPHAAVPDLIVATRRRLLTGVARLRAAVVVCMGKAYRIHGGFLLTVLRDNANTFYYSLLARYAW